MGGIKRTRSILGASVRYDPVSVITGYGGWRNGHKIAKIASKEPEKVTSEYIGLDQNDNFNDRGMLNLIEELYQSSGAKLTFDEGEIKVKNGKKNDDRYQLAEHLQKPIQDFINASNRYKVIAKSNKTEREKKEALKKYETRIEHLVPEICEIADSGSRLISAVAQGEVRRAIEKRDDVEDLGRKVWKIASAQYIRTIFLIIGGASLIYGISDWISSSKETLVPSNIQLSPGFSFNPNLVIIICSLLLLGVAIGLFFFKKKNKKGHVVLSRAKKVKSKKAKQVKHKSKKKAKKRK